MPEIRTCVICDEPFTFMRTVGRPPSICGPACRLESNRRRQARWFARFREARMQLEALQAADVA